MWSVGGRSEGERVEGEMIGGGYEVIESSVTESVLVLIVIGKWRETTFVVTLASVECGWELCG